MSLTSRNGTVYDIRGPVEAESVDEDQDRRLDRPGDLVNGAVTTG